MLVLDSRNTFMTCEQKTSKATESQSPSSLSWQSTVAVTKPGAARGAPPGTAQPDPPSRSSPKGDAEEPVPQRAAAPLHKDTEQEQLCQQINTGLAKAKSIPMKNICDVALAA